MELNTDIRVNESYITITGDPSSAITELTPTPPSIREDGGTEEIKLEIFLQNPLSRDETVQFSIKDTKDNLTDARFDDADVATRDVDYTASVAALSMKKGEDKGTTTITVTPKKQRQGGEGTSLQGESGSWRQRTLRWNPDYRRRHDERYDHLEGGSRRDN